MDFYPQFNFYIIVSTEDHDELVKGGIGTYLGLLFSAVKENLENVRIIWITESPNLNFFVKKWSTSYFLFTKKCKWN